MAGVNNIAVRMAGGMYFMITQRTKPDGQNNETALCYGACAQV